MLKMLLIILPGRILLKRDNVKENINKLRRYFSEIRLYG